MKRTRARRVATCESSLGRLFLNKKRRTRTQKLLLPHPSPHARAPRRPSIHVYARRKRENDTLSRSFSLARVSKTMCYADVRGPPFVFGVSRTNGRAAPAAEAVRWSIVLSAGAAA